MNKNENENEFGILKIGGIIFISLFILSSVIASDAIGIKALNENIDSKGTKLKELKESNKNNFNYLVAHLSISIICIIGIIIGCTIYIYYIKK